MTEINEVLEQRDSEYGGFANNARTSQDIKNIFWDSYKWAKLESYQQEALEMIAHKIARILNGTNPNYLDNWVDICGYSQLVVNELLVKEK